MEIFKEAQGVRIVLCTSRIEKWRSFIKKLDTLNMLLGNWPFLSNSMGSDVSKKANHISVVLSTLNWQSFKFGDSARLSRKSMKLPFLGRSHFLINFDRLYLRSLLSYRNVFYLFKDLQPHLILCQMIKDAEACLVYAMC